MQRWLLALLIALSLPVSAATIASGSLTDPAGDSSPGVSDITLLSMTVDSAGTVLVQARFAPGTFTGATFTAISFDTDQNPATGFPGITNGNADASLIGVEYLLDVNGPDFQNSAALNVFVPPGSFGTTPFTYPVTFLPNGFNVTVPLADLGHDDGLFNFKATIQRQLTVNTYTGIGDYISDLTVAPGVTAPVPEPASLGLVGVGALMLFWLSRRRA